MAIEAVEAEAVRKEGAKLAMPAGSSLRANVSLTPGPDGAPETSAFCIEAHPLLRVNLMIEITGMISK